MRNIMWMVGIAVLLLGCTSKEQKELMKSFEKEKIYHQNLQKTEKTQLYDGEVTKAMLTATYLFTKSEDKNDIRDEKFIVGVYVEEGNDESFVNKGYTLTLNGNAPKSIERLNKNNSLLKEISFNSDWSQFYLITFPHTQSKSFKLIFQSDIYGKGELNFAKISKYVLSGKVL